MKHLLKAAVASSLLLAAAPQAVFAATPVPGIGVANLEAVKANSTAYRTAQQQRQTTYKAQIDQANSRAQQIEAQLKPLYAKFEADRKAAKPDAQLQQQYTQIQQLQQSGQQEVNRILQPVALSEAYVDEQINEQLAKAVNQAVAKKNVSLLLSPEAVMYAEPTYNLNQPILDELNRLLPSAQIAPPAGWQPRAIREARAAQQSQAAQPASAPQGR